MKLTGFILAAVIVAAFSGTAFAQSNQERSAGTYAQEKQSSQEASLAYSNRASMKFLNKDVKGAIQDFDKAIQINPNNPELYLNRGYIKHLTNDLSGAMDDYNRAIQINKNFAYAYNNRGVLRVAMNDIKGAMDDYARAIQINKRYSDVYYNRANLKYMLDDNKGALEDYNIAIELNPKDSEAYNNRGVVKKRMNFNVGALSDYSQAIALNPKDSIAYANRGRLKKLYFDNEGAAIDLDQAVALAETQTFIKNVKPLLSNEKYIAAIPTVRGVVQDYTVSSPAKSDTRIASSGTGDTLKSVSRQVESNTKPETLQKAQKPQQTAGQEISKSQSTPYQQKNEIIAQSAGKESANSSLPSGTISAGVATVQVPPAPNITTTAVKKTPTTNVKLAESYYIRGLQKCVLRDLQGAIADLNKAIENNTKYADAYYYRAAIKKELGDTEGFKKDYSTAIQINPSLQAFNDSNCLTLVQG